MSELAFMMGEFEARFPTDRRYARNHMWALDQESPSNLRFGFTAYAVRLLQDVYFLDWTVEAEVTLKERQTIGAIESKKAESDLFAPLPGTLSCFNEKLLDDPSSINVDKYGEGWLFDMQSEETVGLMSCEQYIEHLGEVWEVTQRTIKGQLNN